MPFCCSSARSGSGSGLIKGKYAFLNGFAFKINALTGLVRKNHGLGKAVRIAPCKDLSNGGIGSVAIHECVFPEPFVLRNTPVPGCAVGAMITPQTLVPAQIGNTAYQGDVFRYHGNVLFFSVLPHDQCAFPGACEQYTGDDLFRLLIPIGCA